MRRLLIGGALGCVLLAAPAFAQNVRVRVDAPPPPEVTVQPHWRWDPDDQVYFTTDRNMPYDEFRYGRDYYVYNNGYWYRASRWSGPFQAMDSDDVPAPLMNLPSSRYQWHGQAPYNDRYSGQYNQRYDTYDNRPYRQQTGYGGYRGAPVIEVRPRWQWDAEDHLYIADNRDMDYDMFRAGNWFYVYDNTGTWYRARSWNGPYRMVDNDNVPRSIYMVSEDRYQWRNTRPQWHGWKHNRHRDRDRDDRDRDRDRD